MSEPKDKDWKKAAQRENARREKAAPLLFHAGLIPKATPEDREASHERFMANWKQQMSDTDRLMKESRRIYRAELAWVLTADQLDAIDEAWARSVLTGTPNELCYEANFYHNKKRQLGMCEPHFTGVGCTCRDLYKK